MRYTHLDKLFTVEGATVALVTLVTTLILCRPRKVKPSSVPHAMNSDDPTGASRIVSFNDQRSPHEIRCALEREHMTPFDPIMNEGLLEYHATSRRNGLPCTFRLVFTSADVKINHYTLEMGMSWTQSPPDSREYHRKSAGSWFDLWCRDFQIGPASPSEPLSSRYRTLATEALGAEAHLTDLSAIQQEILNALRKGATFSTAHKEGGTRIGFHSGRFYRQDFGESDVNETFSDDASFLAFLRKFYDWETSRSLAPDKVPVLLAWRLILRLLNPA